MLRHVVTVALVSLAVVTSAVGAEGFPSAITEIGDYELVHTLNIPNTAAYNTAGITYAVDNTSTLTRPWDRIAYYLELDNGSGLEWAYVSTDAFTHDQRKLGVPHRNTHEYTHQQILSNMNVYSNTSKVTTGTGIATGNIEFWSTNYSGTNSLGIPNATGTHDHGDAYSTGSSRAHYGSMQIHNHDIDGAGAGTTAETIFAYNRWGNSASSNSDLGIGTDPNTGRGNYRPDWTFAQNANTYSVKNLKVLVRPVEPNVFTDVPEVNANGYKLTHALTIPDSGANYNTTGVPYSVNNPGNAGGPFDRVAYYMELKTPAGTREFAYASFDAHTHDASKLGVPSLNRNVKFQQKVSNMNVVSNSAVTNGTGITTGNIEFWPSNYNKTGVLGVGGNDNTYDFDDGSNATIGDGYGSMQVHNHGAGETVMAYNHWGNGATVPQDLGIGNNTGTHPDYTFMQNSGDYEVKNMYVLAKPIDNLVTNVPEAANYDLVYKLAVPGGANTNFNANGVPYIVDNSSQVTESFKRVAYYVELQTPGGSLEYAWVSMEAFTDDVTEIGVPASAAGGFRLQTTVQDMNVVSNAAGVTNGTDLDTGNIEFWSANYGTANEAGIPGADGGKYDFGDDVAEGTPVGYGSMQVHNHGEGETIFAYNAWGSASRVGDLGIGNNGNGHPDWTFKDNAGSYEVKNIYVLVEPGQIALSLSDPTGHIVYQRDGDNQADVVVAGEFGESPTRIEARAVPRDGSGGTATDWQVIDAAPAGGAFSSTLTLEAGWYDIEVRSFDGTTLLGERSVEKVGVGEVFITAGQSNSANSGEVAQTPDDPRVSAFSTATDTWQFAADPQPVATGTKGSPWPELGDLLAEALDVPVAFCSVGWGGTAVSRWDPDNNDLYPRIAEAIADLEETGFRAILWHQGEADSNGAAGSGTSAGDYAAALKDAIDRSQEDADWEVPWGVAIVSYKNTTTTSDPDVTDGQWLVINGDSAVFLGANTDTLIGSPWRDNDGEGIHFSEAGLNEHARLWFVQISTELIPEPATILVMMATGLPALLKRRRSRG